MQVKNPYRYRLELTKTKIRYNSEIEQLNKVITQNVNLVQG